VGKKIKEYTSRKVVEYLDKNTKRIALFFWHGLGDLLMFLKVYHKLMELYPHVTMDLVLQKGVGQEDICPDATFVGSEHEIDEKKYDFVFHIHFPMSEYDKFETPKAEKCCIDELGIDSIEGHTKLSIGKESKFVGISFDATALPMMAGVEAPVANLVWKEVLDLGFIPIETMMEHAYHNRRNTQYRFVNCTLRDCKPKIETMASVIRRCFAFIGTSSGPFHLAMSLLPPNRVAYFQRAFKLITVTKQPIKTFDVRYYQEGEVTDWLITLL
jgi:hypothetical protein